DKKPEDKKPEDKKPEDKKPEDKKPEDKKPEDKKPEDEKPEDKEAEKGNIEEKSPDEKPDDANGDADPSTAGTKKEAVLSDFKDGWHPFDESDEAERLANARGASQAGISDTSSLKDVDKVTIVAHIGVDRDNDGDRDLGTGDGNSIDAKQLAETLRKRGFNGSEVEIMACSSTAFAKELANELRGQGVTVKAYNKDVQVNIDGNVGEHPGRKGVKPDVVPPDDPVNFGTE
ncbi:MAG: hypothetical protein MUC83_12155, partial [Pirellula sp.]|nr:hypothetical protein [Pirellula sp.]